MSRPILTIVIPSDFAGLDAAIKTVFNIDIERYKDVSFFFLYNDIKPLPLVKKCQLSNYTLIEFDRCLNPGDARNQGILVADSDYIAFIDANTVPSSDWLAYIYESVCLAGKPGCFGKVRYIPSRWWHYAFISSSFGFNELECVPGTVLKSELLRATGYFLPQYRAGEDVEWRNRVKLILGLETPEDVNFPLLEYRINSSTNLLAFCLKWSAYYKAAGSIPHLYSYQKLVYLIFGASGLLVTAFIWNWQVSIWNMQSVLFVPYITRSTVLILILSYFLVRCIIIPLRKGVDLSRLFVASLPLILLFSLCLDISKLIGFIRGNHQR